MSQRTVADLLNIGSGSAVCKQLAALPERLSKDRRLRRQVEQAEKRLEEIKNERGQRAANARRETPISRAEAPIRHGAPLPIQNHDAFETVRIMQTVKRQNPQFAWAQ